MIAGAGFSFLIGGLALVLAIIGLTGRGAADAASAPTNLIVGVASIVGAAGYLAFRKWAIPVYVVAVVGHFISHARLLISHGGAAQTRGVIINFSAASPPAGPTPL